jgi:hypothetical protein
VQKRGRTPHGKRTKIQQVDRLHIVLYIAATSSVLPLLLAAGDLFKVAQFLRVQRKRGQSVGFHPGASGQGEAQRRGKGKQREEGKSRLGGDVGGCAGNWRREQEGPEADRRNRSTADTTAQGREHEEENAPLCTDSTRKSALLHELVTVLLACSSYFARYFCACH